MTATKSGFVLKTMDYLENAQISYLFTPDGVESYIVRGAKKQNSKLRALALPFTLITFSATNNKSLNTLTEGEVINNYTSVKENLTKTIVANIIIEKLYQLGNMTNDAQATFDFVVKIADLLAITDQPKSVQLLFEIKLLYRLGLALVVGKCPICDNAIKEGCFSVEMAGMVCINCADNHPENDYLAVPMSQMLRYLYLIQLAKIDEKFLTLIVPYLDGIENAVDRYYQKYLDFTSRSKKIGAKIINRTETETKNDSKSD